MRNTAFAYAFALCVLLGCAAPSLPELTPLHPASPEATEAPLRPASRALAVEEPSLEPADASPEHQRHDH